MEILATRILSNNREIRGHVDSKQDKHCKKAFDFFCNLFKEESSENAAYDTKEEFGVSVHVKKKEDKFSDKKTYDVYITKKEYP